MKTEVEKTYESGFSLAETDVRRLLDVCSERVERRGGTEAVEPRWIVRLRNGAVIETGSVDEVLGLENRGQQQVTELRLVFGTEGDDAAAGWTIDLTFSDPTDEKHWGSITYVVRDRSRDWALVTAGEIDDRVRHIRRVSWPRVFNSRWLIAFALAPFILFTLSIPYVSTDRMVADEISRLHANGELTDAIDTIVRLEQIRAERQSDGFIPVVLSFVGLQVLIQLGLPYLVRRFAHAYEFVWGEQVTSVEKRRSRARVLVQVVALGLVVSVVAGFVVHYLTRM